MQTVTTIGLDIAKSVFQVHGVDAAGQVVIRCTNRDAGDCELEMVVRTDAISFPNSANGLEQVTQVLVANFGDQYENLRTFCLSKTPQLM